jgi:hypothetical protein
MFEPYVVIDKRNVEQFARRVSARAARQVHRRAERIGERMVDEANAIIAAKFINNRAPHRRKGELKLINSLGYRVIGSPDEFPISVELALRPRADPRKVGALNYGFGPKPQPRGIFPGRTPYNVQHWPIRRERNARGRNDTVSKKEITHPGWEGAHFLEGAKRATLRAVRAGQV